MSFERWPLCLQSCAEDDEEEEEEEGKEKTFEVHSFRQTILLPELLKYNKLMTLWPITFVTIKCTCVITVLCVCVCVCVCVW